MLGPVARLLDGKRHLIVVPTGPLTSLPLQVLITRPPAASGADPTPDELRNAAWLIKSHAMSVLPSVQSLSALRKLALGSSATDPFFGMGDPILQGSGPTEQNRGKRLAANPGRFYRSGLADVRAVSELAPLPDTADELRAIGKVLGAPPEAINLREAASETRVKTLPLNNYRVIQFATHGLVAGDLSGLAEPALVLTPPQVPTEANDGLLTASEIAALQAECRLGGAVGLQHGGGRRPGRGGAVGTGARVLLRRCAGPAGLALGGLFRRRRGADHQDLLDARRLAQDRPRRGLPHRHAEPDRRGQAALALGTVRGGRRRRRAIGVRPSGSDTRIQVVQAQVVPRYDRRADTRANQG